MLRFWSTAASDVQNQAEQPIGSDCPSARPIRFLANLNSIGWTIAAWADGSGTEVSWSQNAKRQLAIGRVADYRQTPDKKRAPRPRSNCSCSGLAGTRRGWDGSGPWQDRVRCDDMSRNYPQTTALPICPDRYSERVPQRRRVHKWRRGRADSAAVLAATRASMIAARCRPSPLKETPLQCWTNANARSP